MAMHQLPMFRAWTGIGMPHHDPQELSGREREANLPGELKMVVGSRKAKEPADNSVAATRTAKHRGKAKEITKVQESRWMDQLDWVLHRPLQFTRPRPPWVQEGASASVETTTASASSSNANSELLAAVAKAFPDKSQMPEELRDLVEKANLQSSKSITKDLHSATSSLGKSKKLLQEVVEAKKAHKQAWTRHLTESLELWQKQLQDFTQQQAMLAEKENKAIRDIQLANKSIQNLNLQAAGTEGPMNVSSTLEPAPPANPDLSTQKDKEMIDLQKKLQKCFGECMVATGLKDPKDLVEEIADSEDDEDKKRKRQKSLDRKDGASWSMAVLYCVKNRTGSMQAEYNSIP